MREGEEQVIRITERLTHVSALLLCMCYITLLFHKTYH